MRSTRTGTSPAHGGFDVGYIHNDSRSARLDGSFLHALRDVVEEQHPNCQTPRGSDPTAVWILRRWYSGRWCTETRRIIPLLYFLKSSSLDFAGWSVTTGANVPLSPAL